MSVLLDLSIFPVDQGPSLSRFIAPIVEMIATSGHGYELTAMGTQIETDSLGEALQLIERAQAILTSLGCERVYATAKFDIRAHVGQRLRGKVDAVNRRRGTSGSRPTLPPMEAPDGSSVLSPGERPATRPSDHHATPRP